MTESRRHHLMKGGAVALVCLTILVSTFILANGNIYIKNLGSALDKSGAVANTISVSGDGKVFATPDMIRITITASEIAETSAAALEVVNQKLSQAVEVLRSNGVDANDIQTSNISIYPEYDYSNNQAVLRGQRASASVEAKVKGLDAKASQASKIIDQVAKIDKIQIGSISFDIEDKTAIFSEARKLAYEKADQKAKELAGISGVRLLKPVSISDTTYDIVPPQQFRNASYDSVAGAAPSSETSLSSGQLEISVNLTVLFGIE